MRMIRRFWSRYRYLTVLPVMYVIVAWGYWGVNRSELYPFAPWSMFNDVPNSVTRYVLLVSDDRQLTGIPLWQCFPEGVRALPLPVYRAQRDLGLAIERHEADHAHEARSRLVAFLREHIGSGTAVLTKEVFDPAQKYLHGTNEHFAELGSFTF